MRSLRFVVVALCWGVIAAVILGLAPPVAAQDEAEVHEYPYSDAEAKAMLSERQLASFELTEIEGTPSFEIVATSAQVLGVRANVVYMGEVNGCGSRVQFNVSQDKITPGEDGRFLVVMGGWWDFVYGTRAAPQDICRDVEKVFETVSFELIVAIADGRPLVVDDGGMPVPDSAQGVLSDAPVVSIPEPMRTDDPTGGTGVEAGSPPSDFGDDVTASPDESSEVATTPQAGSDEGGPSYRRPLIAALAVALVIIALVLLSGTLLGDDDDTPEDVVAKVTAELLTDPAGMIETSGELLQLAVDAEARAAAGAAGPTFEATGSATGAATLSGSIDAIAPNGATVTISEGSYPSGPTTTWHGAKWTPINIAGRWYWAPTNKIQVNDAGVGFTTGPPKTVGPLTASRFELTEPLVWSEPATSGDTARRSLPKGNYTLGEVEVTPEGNVYPVWEYADKDWKFHGRIRESLLPRP